MSDIVERWRAITTRPHLVIREEREVGNQMADEIKRLRTDKAAISQTASDYLHEIERLKRELERAP